MSIFYVWRHSYLQLTAEVAAVADPGQLWQEDSQEDPYAHHLQNILLHLTAGLEPDDESLTFGERESADLASDRWIGDLQHQAFSSLKEFYS